jgi:hypothetical protein
MTVLSDEQRMAWDQFEQTFGKLRDGRTATLQKREGGKGYKVKLAEFEKVGDECVFRFEIVDEWEGTA